MLTGDPFPVYYQPFQSDAPAFPTAEKTEDGCLISGLKAWGAAPEALTAWNRTKM